MGLSSGQTETTKREEADITGTPIRAGNSLSEVSLNLGTAAHIRQATKILNTGWALMRGIGANTQITERELNRYARAGRFVAALLLGHDLRSDSSTYCWNAAMCIGPF